MKIQASTAILCDAVTIREGLVHLLGGGVGHLVRPTFPAPLGVDLLLVIEFRDIEADVTSHFLKVDLREADSLNEVAGIEINFQLEAANNRKFQDTPMIVPTRGLGLSAPGTYEMVVNCDSRILWKKLIIVAVEPPE